MGLFLAPTLEAISKRTKRKTNLASATMSAIEGRKTGRSVR